MRYDDASGAFQASGPIANDDAETLSAGQKTPATGNLITGEGTQYGSASADSATGGHITAIAGKGGEDSSFSGGKLSVTGEHGRLTVDAEGNYSYVANDKVENVRDRFTYTLADDQGNTDTAALIVEIGKTPAVIKADAQQIVPGPDGVVVLPAGVDLSDVHVVGRNLVVDLPDGTQLVIIDGAVFVPQLQLGGVEVPASNVATLLIGQEPQPAAGELPPSSGGNFAVPPPPLDPGIPLGDLIPPTEYNYIPPEPEEVFDILDDEPEAGATSAQLDDDAQEGGNPGGSGDDPGSDIASGFLPGSGGDGDLEWSLLPSGELPSGLGLSFAAQPNGDVWLMQNGVHVITISVDPSTGEYDVEQLQALDHADGGAENNIVFTINYLVTDEDGDTALGTLTVDVDDDTPEADVTAGPDGEVVLTTDDAETIGGASDDYSTSADFSGVFTATSVSPGADGAGSGTTDEYTLAVTSQTSGLSSHDHPINLFVVDGAVVGTTAGSAPDDLLDANIVFTVEVDASGVVTLTQMQQIDHADEAPGATDSPFNDQFASLADGLVTLTRAIHLVDGDEDPVDASETVNIGANLHFTDDGPTVDGARVGSSVTLDETDGDEPVSAGDPIVVTSADAMVVGLGVDYGADGQGPDPLYGLSLLGGVNSIASGLATALGDHPITLNLTSPTLITATYDDGGTQTAFTIQMNTDGTITVTQYTALEHLVDGPPGPAHDDSLNLTTEVNEQLVSLIDATVTFEDFDGDTASTSAPIGQAITFKDDGPSVSINVGSDAGIELVTDDDGTEGPGSTSASTTADFSGAFSLGSSSGGGDGTAGVSDISYHLTTTSGADSGLTSNGDEITLYMVGSTVVGAVGAQPADLNDADIVFTVAVDGNGVVTLTQLQQIDHPAVDDPDGTDAPFNDHEISMELDSLIQLHASATITDNDGDTATDDDAVLDIAANLVFRDDGPTINADLDAEASVHVDESLPGVDGAGETDAVGLGQATVAISAIVDVEESPISADQPTTLEYELVLGVAGGNGLVASGHTTSDGDLPIYLYLQGDGSVIGSTATDSGDVDGSNTVFTVAIVGGNVVLTQYQAIEHPTPGASHDENTSGLAANALQLQVTGTDFDGDTDSDSVDLGSVITFGDDGPSVDVLEGNLPTDPQALAAFELVTTDEGTEGAGQNQDSTTADFSGLFSLSKDGGSDGEASSSLTYDLDLLVADGADSGLDSHGATIFLYQVDANTIVGSTSAVAVGVGHPSVVFQLSTTNNGIVTLTQFQQIDHPIGTDPTATAAPFNDHLVALGSGLVNLVATGNITDNDNDTDSDVETIDMGGLVKFRDDGPTADNEGNIATVDDGATALNIGNVSTLLAGDDYGADGPAAVGAITIAVGNEGGTITIDGSGNLLYTAAADASGGNVVETFVYTIKDFDGDTATGTFTVTLTDSGAVVGTTEFAVDEEGLAPNGIPGTVYLDGSDLPGASATASGTLTGLNFGGDGPGDIVLAASADTGLRTIAGQVVQSSWNAGSHTLTGFVDLDANGLDAGDITVFTLQITDVPTGAYTFTLLQPVKHDTANTEDDELFSVGVTVTDSEGDGVSGSINITIDDDSPQLSAISGGGSVTLDETTAVTPAGFPINASSLTAVITATKAFGADGPAAVGDTVYGLSLNGGVNSLASGLQTAVGDLAITLELTSSTVITGTYNGGANTAFTITMNANGTITVVQNVPLEHLTDGPPGPAHDDSLDLVLDGGALTNLVNATITIKDGDGDTHSGSTPIGDQIIFKDDGPSVDVTATNEGNILLTTQDAQTIGVNFDTDASTADFSSVFARTFTTGADGAAAPDISYNLNVLAGDSGLKSHNVTINLYELANGVIVGSTALVAPVSEADASVVFSVSVDADGVVTLKQYQQVDHAVEGTTTSPFDDQFAVLANGKIQLVGSSTITDNDGDTASDSVPIDLGGNLRFADDGPTADTSGVAVGTVTLDESRDVGTDTVGGSAPAGKQSETIDFSVNFVAGGAVNYGADGAGSTVYALSLTGINVASGLFALDNTDTVVDGDGYGQGAQIVLNQSGNVITGSVGATNYFTLTIDPTSGIVTFAQLNNIWHPTAGSSAAALDESATLNTLTADLIKVIQTVTDFDGDTATASINIGQGVFIIQDDGPRFGPDIDATLDILNDDTPINTGDLDIVIGTDSPNGPLTGANPAQTQDDLRVDNFTIMVNDVAATDVVLTPGSEDANSANYSFTFKYPNGDGTTADGTGTLVFNKAAGTYTVELTSGPIEGFSISSVQGDSDGATFYTGGVEVTGSGEVAVSELADNFFIQFTGRSGVTGSNGTFGNDEIFNGGTAEDVKISSTAIGVHGNSVQDKDVLDYNFYESDPGGTIGNPPTASAATAFIQITQFNPQGGGGEDFIVVLKLADPDTPGTFITRTIVVQSTDVITTDVAGFPPVGTNGGLIIIEPNDYRGIDGVPDDYEIVGMQLRSSTEGLASENNEVYNFNGALGAGDGSATNFAAGDNDNDVFKIIDIGASVTTTEDQTATIEFDVVIHDADGDTATQHITVNVGDTQSALAVTEFSSLAAPEQESSFSNLSFASDERALNTSGSNMVVAAAVAAAGFADSEAAASLPDESGHGQEVAEVAASVGPAVQAAADDAGNESRSLMGNEAREAADDVAATASSGHSEGPADSGHSLDESHAVEPEWHQSANDDHGPAAASASASPAVPTVAMVSAEALQAAASLDGGEQGGSNVEQIVADALGHDAAPTVDGILANLPGGIGELNAIADMASADGSGVPAWDMGMQGAFGQSHDMLFKVAAAVAVHHDAVQPA